MKKIYSIAIMVFVIALVAAVLLNFPSDVKAYTKTETLYHVRIETIIAERFLILQVGAC